jgi:hypothetical protein
MVRFTRALASFVLFSACRAVPSATPLADTGEGRSFEDGALSRNRVPRAARAPSPSDDDHDASKVDETIVIAASAADAGDSGAPDAGVALGDAGTAGSAWAGEYFGSDRHATRATGIPEKVELDDKAHTRVAEPSPGVVVFSLVSSGDGTVICSLKASATGNRAEVDPGESCGGLFLMPPLAVEGSAKLTGDELELKLEGHGEFPGEDRAIEMDIEYRFEGKRR